MVEKGGKGAVYTISKSMNFSVAKKHWECEIMIDLWLKSFTCLAYININGTT